MKISKALLKLVTAEVVILAALVFVLKSFALSFFLSYLFLFFLPALPMYQRLKDYEFIEQITLLNLFGLTFMSLVWYVTAVWIIPVKQPVIIATSLLVFLVNLYIHRKHFISSHSKKK